MRLFKEEHLPGGITEKWYSEKDGTIHRKVSQNTTGVIKAIDAASEFARGDTQYHLGSVPITIANKWSKECGAGIGTREFAEYAKKKLMDPDWKAFSTGIKV